MTGATADLRRAGREALAIGNVEAVRRVAAALQSAPGGDGEAYFLLAVVEAGTGRTAAALELIKAAVAHAPSAEYEAQLARLLLSAGRDGEAREAAIRAETLRPTDALTFDTLGCVHTRLGSHADALRLFKQAVAHAPDNRNFRYNLAVELGFAGQPDRAEQHFDAIIAAAPTDGRAHFALSGLRRQTPERNHIARLEQALAAAQNPDDRLRIGFALGKEYEECGQPAEALRHLQQAGEQRRERSGYTFARDARLFDAVEHLFAGRPPLSGSGDPAAQPIFVVGMPRTGTTLVDRILSSHAKVWSAGELAAMPLAIKQAAATRTRTVVDAETIAAARGQAASDVAAFYLARARQQPAVEGQRFVDKLPFNFLYVGFIRQAFPAAKIVCLRRDPMDTIWSNYRHLFADGSAFHDYSYDPEGIARYYLRFDRLIAFWRDAFPGAVLELGYEDLIRDQAGETRRLLDHCELDWDENCLRFHEQDGAVATPSAAQVRRPLNADAIGQWRPHADALGAARRLIEDAALGMTRPGSA
ncbi:tetratricopeptide repeat-containing sulfotransferase family protein [Sphingopyxis macrogoltabida]|uniref:Sulfotransferase n=1 Tax=Sphingopyxis macrogoltabida TaxID=33050 RepID=A0AAC8YXW4_SPHMC|nr:sulfotransferase [Sphingopyxis macrogoltabida]ALJ12127.1 hypothetical protein LH19_04535 [Sphingopyxis macrogoltabida]AMU88303.1 hypothetical protein ATM17_04500 [Sphingopyxis macrogoltabida]